MARIRTVSSRTGPSGVAGDRPGDAGASAGARLFLAVWPDAAARSATVAAQGLWSWPRGARRVPAERLHLTLHFIGEVDRVWMPVLADALAVDMRPATLVFDHCELWTRGLAVLRARETPDTLAALHAELAARLRRLEASAPGQAGLRRADARLRPHVTLARQAAAVPVPELPTPVIWPVEGYALVESVLGPGGGYRVLRRYGRGCVPAG